MNALALPAIWFLLSAFSPHPGIMAMAGHMDSLSVWDIWIAELQRDYKMENERVLLLSPRDIRVTLAALWWPKKNEYLPEWCENVYSIIIVESAPQILLPTWMLTYCYKMLRYGGRLIISHERHITLTMEKN